MEFDLKMWVGITFLTAVAIRVVAAEKNTRLVTIGDLGVPSNGLSCAGISEVLLVDLAGVTPSKDVVTCMTDEGQGLVKGLLNLGRLCDIAGRVDRERVD